MPKVGHGQFCLFLHQKFEARFRARGVSSMRGIRVPISGTLPTVGFTRAVAALRRTDLSKRMRLVYSIEPRRYSRESATAARYR